LVGGNSAYEVQANNSNPLIRNNLPPQEQFSTNPEFDSNWVKIGTFDSNGFFASNSYVRLVRLVNSFGLTGTAHFFTEKQVPVIQ